VVQSAGDFCNQLGTGASTAGAVFNGIAADPIDPNYQAIATAGVGPGLVAADVPGLSPAQQAALDDLTSALNDISALPDLIQTSFNRAEGAYQASDPIWESLQLFATGEYAGLAEGDLDRIDADANTLEINLTGAPASVPEPSTLILFSTAATGILFIRSRQLRKSRPLRASLLVT
jgi:hypothetical protein